MKMKIPTTGVMTITRLTVIKRKKPTSESNESEESKNSH